MIEFAQASERATRTRGRAFVERGSDGLDGIADSADHGHSLAEVPLAASDDAASASHARHFADGVRPIFNLLENKQGQAVVERAVSER